METSFQAKCDLFAENRNLVTKGFLLENSLVKIASALIYTEADKEADNEYLQECRKLLRKKAGALSDFRGISEMLVSAKLAQQADPERFMADISSAYKMFHEGRIFGSRYMALAAISICDAGKINQAKEIVEKANEILKGMKKEHPFLTSDEDTCFAVLLAMTDKSTEVILNEVEENFQILKKDFKFHDNAVYSLAQILAMKEGSNEQKCQRALEIYKAFENIKAKYGKGYELASIGTLIDIDRDANEMAKEIAEASAYLKSKKGFGMLDLDDRTRLMFSAILYGNTFAGSDTVSSSTALESTIAMVIAQEITYMIIMVTICSGSVAAASSN